MTRLISDTSVVRNFSILGWGQHLAAVSGGKIVVVHGVLGLDADESGELDVIAKALGDEANEAPGSRSSTLALMAQHNLDALLLRRGELFEILVPTEEEVHLAVRLQDRGERDWRAEMGMRARRLDSGEAISIAAAVGRQTPFASDDGSGRTAYLALGGSDFFWSLDLMQRCIEEGLLDEGEARDGYERLRNDYRFWGPPWNS